MRVVPLAPLASISSGDSSVEAEKPFVLSGVFILPDDATLNQRVYPLAILKTAVLEYLERIKRFPRAALGEVDHPPPDVGEDIYKSITIARASHQVLDLVWSFMPDGRPCLKGYIRLIDSPAGALAKKLYERGSAIGISLRGWSSEVEDSATGNFVVQDDLKLITWDLVLSPAVESAVLKRTDSFEIARSGAGGYSRVGSPIPAASAQSKYTLDTLNGEAESPSQVGPSPRCCGCFGGLFFSRRRNAVMNINGVPQSVITAAAMLVGKKAKNRRRSYEEQAWKEGRPIFDHIETLLKRDPTKELNVKIGLGLEDHIILLSHSHDSLDGH